MEKYVVLGIVAIVVFGPLLAWRIYRIFGGIRSVNEFVSKPFACPNCGHRFYTQQKVIHPIGENKAYLKCPACKKRDVCSRPYDFDPNEP